MLQSFFVVVKCDSASVNVEEESPLERRRTSKDQMHPSQRMVRFSVWFTSCSTMPRLLTSYSERIRDSQPWSLDHGLLTHGLPALSEKGPDKRELWSCETHVLRLTLKRVFTAIQMSFLIKYFSEPERWQRPIAALSFLLQQEVLPLAKNQTFVFFCFIIPHF